jgi:phosphopantetheinyl transferase (holo-ACP synthase)
VLAARARRRKKGFEVLHGKTSEKAASSGSTGRHISITHSENLADASVIAERA